MGFGSTGFGYWGGGFNNSKKRYTYTYTYDVCVHMYTYICIPVRLFYVPIVMDVADRAWTAAMAEPHRSPMAYA